MFISRKSGWKDERANIAVRQSAEHTGVQEARRIRDAPVSPAAQPHGPPDPELCRVAGQPQEQESPSEADRGGPGPLAGREQASERPHGARVQETHAGRADRQGPDPAPAGRADLGH